MDWEDDLNKLRTFFDKPDAKSTEDATEMLIGILYHLIPHMTTAGTLLLDRVPNPFVGAQLPFVLQKSVKQAKLSGS